MALMVPGIYSLQQILAKHLWVKTALFCTGPWCRNSFHDAHCPSRLILQDSSFQLYKHIYCLTRVIVLTCLCCSEMRQQHSESTSDNRAVLTQNQESAFTKAAAHGWQDEELGMPRARFGRQIWKLLLGLLLWALFVAVQILKSQHSKCSPAYFTWWAFCKYSEDSISGTGYGWDPYVNGTVLMEPKTKTPCNTQFGSAIPMWVGY